MSPRNIKDLLKMRHAVESIRNRKSTTGATNQEFIQSLKMHSSSSGGGNQAQSNGGVGAVNYSLQGASSGNQSQANMGTVSTSYLQKQGSNVKRTPSNESANVGGG
jgi:hypothetical protein